MMHIAGILSSGGGSPSYGTLVDKLIALGATEIWLHDDVSGGAAALYDSDNDLLVTGDTGANLVYEHAFSAFPDMKGIDMSDISGEKAYLSTLGAATTLHETGSVSMVQLGVALKAATSFQDAPFIGLAVSGSGADNINLFAASAYIASSTSLFSRYMNEYGTGSDYETNLGSVSNIVAVGTEYLFGVTRDSGTKLIRSIFNGEEKGVAKNYAGKEPVNGVNSKFVQGRDVMNLGASERQPDIFGLTAYFKSALTVADHKEIMDAATNFEGRTGGVPDEYQNIQAWGGNALLDGVCMVYSKTSNKNTTLGAASAVLGLTAYAIQMNTGSQSFTASSGHSIVGATTTVTQGDIIKIECTDDTLGAVVFEGTLYST